MAAKRRQVQTPKRRSERPPAAPVAGEVVGLAGRGDAVVRLSSNEVVFVRAGAPGDRVLLQLSARRSGVLRGAIVEVVSPGQSRVEPFCPVADRCGGCSWQHVTVVEQRRQKLALAQRALRLSADQLQWQGALPETGWRRRARLHLRRVDGRLTAGFAAARSHDHVPVSACPVLVPAINAVLEPLLRWLEPTVMRGEIMAVAGVQGVVAELAVAPMADAAPPKLDDSVLAQLGLVGLVLQFGRIRLQRGRSDVALDEARSPWPISCSAAGFAQAGAAANAAIRTVLAEFLDAIGPRDHAVEFYSGSANLGSLLDGRVARITTVELDSSAVARARQSYENAEKSENAENAEKKTTVTFLEGAAETLAPAVGDAPLWLLDPGRPGAKALLVHAEVFRPRDIVYVSCAFDTLARDVAALRLLGYHIERARLVDTFVHTPHFELVVWLRLASP